MSEATNTEKGGTSNNWDAKQFAIRYGFLIVMAALYLLFSILEPAFLTWSNQFSILLGIAIYGILALGVTFTLVVDGLDLSIGSVAALSVMISSYCMVVLEQGAVISVIICLLLGALVGLLNGLLIVKMKIPDLLTTLGMMFLIQGLQLIPSAGRTISEGMLMEDGEEALGFFDPSFLYLGQGRLFGVIPIPVIVMLVIALLVYIVLDHTRWGRVMYAIGGNPEATRLAGAPVNLYRIMAYVISGTIASIGGVLLVARVGVGDITSGTGLLLDAVGAALIGFAVFGVRRPNPFGTLVGAIFIGVLLSGLTMLSLPYYTQDFIKGGVLVLSLMFTFALAKRS